MLQVQALWQPLRQVLRKGDGLGTRGGARGPLHCLVTPAQAWRCLSSEHSASEVSDD
jgi:hypothetical protein